MSTKKVNEIDISERIGSMIDILAKGNVAQFSRDTGINAPVLRRYLEGREPKFSFFQRIHEAYKINPKWLMYGTGNMFDEERTTNDKFLNDIDEWLKSRELKEPWAREAFEFEIKESQPRFKRWIETREKQGLQDNTISGRKVA